MNRQQLLTVLGAFALLATLRAAPINAQEMPTLRFQVFGKTIIHLPDWVMLEKGLCKKQGIKCEAVTLSNAPLALAAASAGSVDVVNATIDTALPAIDKGHDLKIVGATINNNPYVLVYRSDIPSPANGQGYPAAMSTLKGKKVGVASRGSSTETFLKLALAGAGLPPDSVVYVPVGGPATAFAALAAKQIDATVTWNPVPTLCEVTSVCKLLVDMRKGEGPESFRKTMGTAGFLVAPTQYVEKHPDRIDAFNRARAEAVVWIKDPNNAAEVLEIVKKNTVLGPNIGNIEQAYTLMIADTVPYLTAEIQPSSIANWQAFLLDNRLIENARPVDSLLYKNAPAGGSK